MRKLNVWRIGDEDAQLVGEIFDQPIAFRYSASYLESSEAHAISLSLPLRDDSFSEEELVPYFNGLLPENETRTAIANALRTTPDDFLTILLHCGREIIGDVAITEEEPPIMNGSYVPLS